VFGNSDLGILYSFLFEMALITCIHGGYQSLPFEIIFEYHKCLNATFNSFTWSCDRESSWEFGNYKEYLYKVMNSTCVTLQNGFCENRDPKEAIISINRLEDLGVASILYALKYSRSFSTMVFHNLEWGLL